MASEAGAEVGTEAEDRFHQHLDRCRQCREQVFNLCSVGRELLMAVAKEGFRGLEQWNRVLQRGDKQG